MFELGKHAYDIIIYIACFIVIGQLLLLLWQLSFHRLKMEKWKLTFLLSHSPGMFFFFSHRMVY